MILLRYLAPSKEPGLGKDCRVRTGDYKRCLGGTALKAAGFSLVELGLRYWFVPSKSPRWVSFPISPTGPSGTIF